MKSSSKNSRSQTQLSATSSPATSELSSAYDRNLPAALVGEAVRSALRSDRGICFDFTTDHYADGLSGTSGNRLVSVVKMHGDGTRPFINAKFSQFLPNNAGVDAGDGGGVQLSPNTELVRKGQTLETAYLTGKGRIIDRLLVLAFSSDTDKSNDEMGDAFLITSPGNSGATLYNELSPLVFPMDKVTLTECSTPTSHVMTLACSSLENAQLSFKNNVLKLLMKDDSYCQEFDFPKEGICHHYRVSSGDSETFTDVYLMQHTALSSDICRGYTLLFQESGANNSGNHPTLADQIWNNLTDEHNDKGPVGMGSLEYDTLRVEAGLPGYGNEMTGDGPKKSKLQNNDTAEKKNEQDENVDDTYYAKSSPLELHLESLVDTNKGCYQGQEGIASIMKNKRGPPRQLYQAVFYDSENDFDGEGGGFGLINTIDNEELMDFQRLKKQADPIDNDTRHPRPGDSIYVLGSNESIQVGKITSVAEPNGTGDAKTVALALVKRPGSILKAIKEQGLDLPRWWEDAEDGDEEDMDTRNIAKNIASEKGGSGMMQPPPLDALYNLEVVVGGTYTVGRLISVPSRRYNKKSSGSGDVATLLDYEQRGQVVDDNNEGPAYFKYASQDEEVQGADAIDTASLQVEEGDDDEEMDELLAKAEEEAAKAAAAAEAAAADAKRKEEKMKLLKAKAEAAMAARRKKKEASS